MKKFILALTLVLCFCLVGCNKPDDTPHDSPNDPVEKEYDWSQELTEGYRVRVLYPDGSVVEDHAIEVQWCTVETCKRPVTTSINGIAYTIIEDDEYFIHIHEYPAGYGYNPNIYKATPSNRSIEIQLFSLSETSSALSACGYYTTTLENKDDTKTYTFTASEAGTYVIETLATAAQALDPIDPLIICGDDYNDNSGEGINAKYEVTLEAGASVTFSITTSKAATFDSSYPNEFLFSIIKK